MFGKVCAENEYAYHARRADVLKPIKKYADATFDKTLPFYGVNSSADREKIIKEGSIHRKVRTLQSCNWQSLAAKIEKIDNRRIILEHDKQEPLHPGRDLDRNYCTLDNSESEAGLPLRLE